MRVHNLQGDTLDLATTITAAFAPPPDQSPSAWAEANLVLTSDFASEPGQYNLDRTPWCRAPLDDAADATVDTVIITGSSQCGKTQLSLAVAAYFAGVLPCPIMHIVPTDGLSGTFAARFDSMIAASAALRDKFVKPRRTRAVANKSVKTFDGGVLILASAASPTDLSSRPIKVAIADGGLLASKPYAASGAYINRMSDYCKGCVYDVKLRTGPKACPFNALYWDFISRHTATIKSNPRMAQMVRSYDKFEDAEKARITESAATFLAGLKSSPDYS